MVQFKIRGVKVLRTLCFGLAKVFDKVKGVIKLLESVRINFNSVHINYFNSPNRIFPAVANFLPNSVSVAKWDLCRD